MISVGTTVQLGSSLQDTNVGIELFYVIPVEVTYQWGNVHFLVDVGVAIPVASYDPMRLANASHNYYGSICGNLVTFAEMGTICPSHIRVQLSQSVPLGQHIQCGFRHRLQTIR